MSTTSAGGSFATMQPVIHLQYFENLERCHQWDSKLHDLHVRHLQSCHDAVAHKCSVCGILHDTPVTQQVSALCIFSDRPIYLTVDVHMCANCKVGTFGNIVDPGWSMHCRSMNCRSMTCRPMNSRSPIWLSYYVAICRNIPHDEVNMYPSITCALSVVSCSCLFALLRQPGVVYFVPIADPG